MCIVFVRRSPPSNIVFNFHPKSAMLWKRLCPPDLTPPPFPNGYTSTGPDFEDDIGDRQPPSEPALPPPCNFSKIQTSFTPDYTLTASSRDHHTRQSFTVAALTSTLSGLGCQNHFISSDQLGYYREHCNLARFLTYPLVYLK